MTPIAERFAALTRKITNAPGLKRVIVPMMRHVLRHLRTTAAKVDGDSAAWVTIPDYRGHYFLKIDRNAYMGSSIFWLGWHHRWEIEYLERALSPDEVFVDVGANLGEFTIALAGRLTRGRVIAFEPHATTRLILTESVALNGFRNVQIMPCGLGAKEAEAVLFNSSTYREDGLKNEGLFTQYPSAQHHEAVAQIVIRRFDALRQELHLDRLDWMKIDVEGAEWPVLQGAESTLDAYRPRLLLEINRDTFAAAGYSAADLVGWLAAKGYRPYKFASFGRILPISTTATFATSTNVLMLPQAG